MIKIIDNQVYEIEIVVTGTQEAHVMTYKCPQFKTILSYNNSIVTAEFKDWEENLQTNFNGDIIFEFSGERLSKPCVNGIASIDFVGESGGQYTVKTVDENIDNGSVTFYV